MPTPTPSSERQAPASLFDVGCSRAPSPPVLILTAGYGEGHNAAARAVAAACAEIGGSGAARTVDLFALASPRMNAIARDGYLRLINRSPRLWSLLYTWMDRSVILPRTFGLLRRDLSLLAQILASERPGAICCTYPVYAFLLERLRRQGKVQAPHYNVVTDSISINSLWWRAGSAGWFLPNEDSAEVLLRAGIDARKMHVSGFPVTLFFAQHRADYFPSDLATGATPRVLHIINTGTRNAEATAHRLMAQTDWEVTCAVGRDERLRQALEKVAARRTLPTQILGWTDTIPRLLMTHHCVVSKAGGATTQESIAARCPMIVSQVVPGQEEGNYELLRRHGAGELAETPEAVIAVLRRAFADRGSLWNNWRAALTPLCRPDAARHIAKHLLEVAGKIRPAAP